MTFRWLEIGTRRWEFSRKLDSSLQYIVEYVYMIFQCNFNTISWNYLGQLKELLFDALVDTGADCSVFDIDFVERQLLPWTRREKPVCIRGINGSLCKRSGKVQVKGLQIQVPDLKTGQMKKTSLQTEVMTFGDKQLNSFPLILGIDWIQANIEKIDIR